MCVYMYILTDLIMDITWYNYIFILSHLNMG